MEYGVVLLWWLTFLALAVAGLPIAAIVARTLPDRGAGIALPVALVVLWLPIYWLGHLTFGTWSVAAGVLVLGALTFLSARRGPEIRFRRFGEVAAVFSVAFLFLVAIRAVDPAVLPVGGEKFLDYGLLNSVLRSSALPPEDMWFAGRSVHYYYGGHLLAGILTTLTGTAPKFAYNLALAGMYATLVSTAYGIAGSISAGRDLSYPRGGMLGAFFVGFASNLVPVVQAVVRVLPEGLARWIASIIAGSSALTVEELLGQGRVLYYWVPSRVIRGTINEFPLFAWYNGDLHAHMLSTPFLLLVVGLALAYYRTPEDRVRRRRLLLFGAIPAVGGVLAVVNTWSFPSVGGIAGLTALFAPADPRGVLPTEWRGTVRSGDGLADEVLRMGVALGVTIGVVLLGFVWALPFFFGPALAGSSRSLWIVSDRSGLIEFLLVHGWVLGIFAVYLGGKIASGVERPAHVGVLAVLLVGVGVLSDAAALGVMAPLLFIAWLRLRDEDGELGFETVLFVAGGGLVVLVELVYVVEKAGPGRFNTVFKTYSQVWILWATAAGVALLATFPDPTSDRLRSRVGTVLSIGLILSLSIYGGVVLGGHFQNVDEATLDVTTGVEQRHPAILEGIRFLDRKEGQPNLVSAPGSPYRWVSAPPSFTGLPTVVTGLHHERVFHGAEAVEKRVKHVRTIYTGSATRRARLLREYNVRYIWVGPWVKRKYGQASLTVSEAPGIVQVFENSEVTIYRVRPEMLPG